MALKPWCNVITLRENLRQGRPLYASEFAAHLDQVRDGPAPVVYQDPTDSFERTSLTKNVSALAPEVHRWLSGVKVETTAVFNQSTQFGGGKTHVLAFLYHRAQDGPEAADWKGVRSLVSKAGVAEVPRAPTAVFAGTTCDSLSGRGGVDGTPIRKTLSGEIAWQLMGVGGLGIVAEHEKITAPGGDVVSRILLADRPVLILFDELMNYVSRSRESSLASQLYNFLHNLSEVAWSRDNVVLAVSIRASDSEVTAEDQSDYEPLKNLLDRLGNALIMSAEAENSEIIQRRLFESHGLFADGLPVDASKTVARYEERMGAHRHQLPSWFSVDNAREALGSTYPFHPSVLSVFDRKWQVPPRFHQICGVLRLLTRWVSRAYVEGVKGAHKDPLITLSPAPLDLDGSTFPAAVCEQLGESRFEAAVTSDVAGKEPAHVLRLDKEATTQVKNARLHRKVATTIFFESNGGQHRGEATLPEVRLAGAEPGLDIGNVEQSLDALSDTCYFLLAEKNRFRFSYQPNLNELLADRQASVSGNAIGDRVRAEIEKVFAVPAGRQGAGKGVERVFFPERTNQVPDRAALTLVVLAPENEAGETATAKLMETMAKEHGSSSRTYRSALIWCVAEDGTLLFEEARQVVAWEDIDAHTETMRIDESQHRQLEENLKRTKRDLQESVWRIYKNVFLLDEKNALRKVDLGLVHSSAADSLVALVLGRLQHEDLVVDGVSPNFLVRNWPPALPEVEHEAVRDAFFASPKFPRVLNPDTVKQTICRVVEAGMIAYASRTPDAVYDPFVFQATLKEGDLEVTDDVFVIRKEDAEAYIEAQRNGQPGGTGGTGTPTPPTGTGSGGCPPVGTGARTSSGGGARLQLDAADRPTINPDFDEVTALLPAGQAPLEPLGGGGVR